MRGAERTVEELPPGGVLFLNPSGQLGGAERSLLDIIASLRRERPELRLGLVVTADGPLVERARGMGVEGFVLPLPEMLSRLGDGGAGPKERRSTRWALARSAPAAAMYALRLRRLISRFSPGVVHSNGFKMHVLGMWSCPRGVPLVWHVHDFVSRRPVMSILMRHHFRGASAIIANSKSVSRDIGEVCGDGIPVHTVYNAVDVDAFSPTGYVLDVDALSGLEPAAERTIRVGLVATLGWWKGHETFLEAISLLPADLPVRGYVIGGALYETVGSQHSLENLRARARDLGISGRVGFTGFTDEVPAAMRALDIVVHASTEPEAFGLVIIEGMATGRPVIASDAGGASELIAGGKNALGHEPGNARDLADRIEELVLDEGLRRRLSQQGRTVAEREFDRARLATDLIPIYGSVAGGRR